MKTTIALTIATILACNTAALCAESTRSENASIETALTKYLSKHGDLCVGKFHWPIDVGNDDIEMRSRDAVQMPILEKQGLVASSSVSAKHKNSNGIAETISVRRYVLTKAGKKFYLDRGPVRVSSGGKKIIRHRHDLCAGRLSLKTLVRSEPVTGASDQRETVATYTYSFAPAPWALDPQVRQVFPMIDRIINGEANMQLQQRFRLGKQDWVPAGVEE